MKKRILCCILAAILLAMTIPAFAEGRSMEEVSYDAGYTTPVRHWFKTSRSVAKNSGETWLSIMDDADESYFCNKNGGNAVQGNHNTYLANNNGDIISTSSKNVPFSGSASFSARDMGENSATNIIRLRIYNPKYNSDSTTQYLQTKGSFRGATK